MSNSAYRNQPIDLLRGICIIAVILLHINLRMPFDKGYIGQSLPPEAIKILFWSGYYGVVIFFVISGFLITLTSIHRWRYLQNIQYDQFYLMRFARIFPCLTGLLIILSLLDILHIKGFMINSAHTSLLQANFSALTFHLNWLEAKAGYLPGSWDVLWSLSVEEAFYFFFPLICKYIKSEKNFVFIMIIFIILGPFARTILSHNELWQDKSYLSSMDGIAFGCLAALFVSRVKMSGKLLYSFLFGGLIFSLFIIIFRTQAYHMGISALGLNATILELGISLMLVALYILFTTKKSENLIPGTQIFQWFGKNSYEIYLTHMFPVILLAQLFHDTHQPYYMISLWYILILSLSGVSGYLVSRYYSKPMNKVLRTKIVLPVR